MKRDPRLDRLVEMAEMVLDARSAGLRKAAATRLALLGQLEALEAQSQAMGDDLASARAAYAFEQWAAVRRAEINTRLAAAQAEWMAQQDETRRAFGRRQVLSRLRGDK